MREILEFDPEEIRPELEAVLRRQGIPDGAKVDQKIFALIENALEIFVELSQPLGTVAEVNQWEFQEIYEGEGLNDTPNPVAQIFPKADKMALYALTLGSEISQEIADLFENHEFALASILDAVASEAAENANTLASRDYLNYVIRNSIVPSEKAILCYSPGYCGWHISGQKKLHEFLQSEEIGIILNDSFMMEPLKSISGVMIYGDKKIHEFDDSYPFCDKCLLHECRDRIRALSM